MSKLRIIVHGGAGDWADQWDVPKRESLEQAALLGYAILQAGGSALDAVERATMHLEDDPLFDAGTGSFLNIDGVVEMDAMLIDAATHDFGAVAGVQRVRHPILLARKVMQDTPHNFIVGAGADALAVKFGLEVVPNLALVTDMELSKFRKGRDGEPTEDTAQTMDTVGAVALDVQGNLAVATSTGGAPNKLAGRVGDSPVFGAGGYAHNQYGGASATGWGEHSLRTLLSKDIVDQIAAGADAQAAVAAAMRHADALFADSQLGAIVIDKAGRYGAAHTTTKISIAWIDEAGRPHSSIQGGVTTQPAP